MSQCFDSNLLIIFLNVLAEDITTDGKWEWGGCSDNIAYGYRISKDFMDLKKSKRSEDIRTAVHRHNNEAGRQVRGIFIWDFFKGGWCFYLGHESHPLCASFHQMPVWALHPTLVLYSISCQQKKPLRNFYAMFMSAISNWYSLDVGTYFLVLPISGMFFRRVVM